MPTRAFTRTHLTSYLNLPPTGPQDVKYRDDVHLDEHLRTLKYTQRRRCVFTAEDGRTYAVEYDAPLDTGDYEVGDGPVENHGWNRSVLAVQVELRPVPVEKWMPVPDDGPDPDQGADPAQYHLAEIYMETGCREADARTGAAELLAQHARELAVLLGDAHPEAAQDLRGHAADLDRSAGQADGPNVVDQDEGDEPEDYEETDSDSEVLALIAEIAGRLKDATDEGEYHAVGLIYDLANGTATVADCRIDLAEITFRHV